MLTAMALSVPSPRTTNPLARIREDLGIEWRASRRGPLPPGSKLPSLVLTERMRRDPLAVLLTAYEEHGPIFAIRIFHGIQVFMLGPEANRYMLVTDRDKFRWRDGNLGDLIPLIGDGLLTTDGEYHDRARQTMLPVFHRERIAATADVMSEEAVRAMTGWRAGERVDLYDWTRHVAMRVAMRALFGFDPDRSGVDVAATFETGLSFYEREYFLQVLRGPGSPFARLRRVRRTLDQIILGEIARRRRAGEPGEDVLGLLMEARDDRRPSFDDGQVRDQVLTLLFAGHDTTTSTVAFMFYELARDPEWAERLATEQRDGSRRGGAERRSAVRGDACCSTWLFRRPCGSTLRRGSARGERSRTSSSPATACRRGSRSTTPPGRAIACPRCFRTRMPSSPSASSPRHERNCPRAPTSPSVAARGSASGCVSASSRSGRSRRRSWAGSASDWSPIGDAGAPDAHRSPRAGGCR